jgi:predicted RNA polymerase sigma factor
MKLYEIVEMADKAGIIFGYPAYQDRIEIFAKLVEERAAAKEREACAKAVENLRDKSGVNEDGNAWLTRLTRGDCVNAIRARGET